MEYDPCARSHALGAAFLLLLTLRHDGGAQAAAEVVGQFVELRVAVNLDGLLRRVANNVAVVAPGKMIFQLDFGFFVENAVQITGQLVKELRAFHRSPSPIATSFLTSPFLAFFSSPFSRR